MSNESPSEESMNFEINAKGKFHTAVGELEMSVNGNHIDNLEVIPDHDSGSILLQVHTNHRSEDLEMEMQSIITPPMALALGAFFRDFAFEQMDIDCSDIRTIEDEHFG